MSSISRLASAVSLLAAIMSTGAFAALPDVPNLGTVFRVEFAGATLPGVTRFEFIDPPEYLRRDAPNDASFVRLTRALANVSANTTDFLKWRYQRTQGRLERRDLSIVLFDNTGVERGRVLLGTCFPVAWRGPSLPTNSQVAVVTESIEVQCATVGLAGTF